MTDKNGALHAAGYVLAGGASSRFGRDKALVEFDGKTMLVRMCELLGRVAGDVTVIAEPKKYVRLGLKCVVDNWPGQGPLGGIITALEDAGARKGPSGWNLVVGCDMPFLTPEWMQYMAAHAEKSAAQVILPHSASGPEPLCACYRADALRPLRSAFEGGVRKITEALKQARTEVLDEAHWKRFDSAGRLFWNMNTAADFEAARRILETERK